MKSGNRDKAEGKFHEIKAKVKVAAGELADNPNGKPKVSPRRPPARLRPREVSSAAEMFCDHLME